MTKQELEVVEQLKEACILMAEWAEYFCEDEGWHKEKMVAAFDADAEKAYAALEAYKALRGEG